MGIIDDLVNEELRRVKTNELVNNITTVLLDLTSVVPKPKFVNIFIDEENIVRKCPYLASVAEYPDDVNILPNELGMFNGCRIMIIDRVKKK